MNGSIYCDAFTHLCNSLKTQEYCRFVKIGKFVQEIQNTEGFFLHL